MINRSIFPVSGITMIGISDGCPTTLTITVNNGSSTLNCTTPEMAQELLTAIWDALVEKTS
jgi:hypothetical protein